MEKHAYLIKAHHQFGLLKKLLELLDDPRNDIYIHIGLDVKYDAAPLVQCVRTSGVYFVPGIREEWGGFSQIRSEMELFRAAASHGYMYYHLLSGADLPLKTQDEIHRFFDENKGYEFIYFCPESFWKESAYKYEQYHLFQEWIGRRQKGVWFQAERISLFLQRRIGIRRSTGNMTYCLGANWVSITHDLVQYLLGQEKLIRKMFRHSLCCDEFFIQTLVWNSPYRKRVFSLDDDYYACLRLIDWKRGSPYVWRKQDYMELMDAPHLFARKFDEETDREIIDLVYGAVKDRQRRIIRTGEAYEK